MKKANSVGQHTGAYSKIIENSELAELWDIDEYDKEYN